MKIIFVAPRFDQATGFSFKWCKEIEDYAKQKGEDVILLNVEDAVREKVEKVLSENPAVMFVHYNHGNEDRIYGNDERPVIDMDNYNLLKNRECYNMNCLSAKVLGKGAYLHYHATYWGYVESFAFTTDSLEEFKEAANYGFKLRVDGETNWGVILKKAKEKFTELIDGLIASGRVFAASLLRDDRDALHCWSDDAEQPDSNPPPPTCPVSRFIQKYFGYKFLETLRLTRDWWQQPI